MAELENSFEKIEDVDPAADFIAREQNVLAEIGNDIEFKNEMNHVNQENGENGEDPDLGSTALPADISNSIPASNSTSNGLSNQVNGDKEPIKEPEKIRKWREEQQNMLKQKDEEEIKKKKELAEQAKKELEEWYSRYEEQLNKSKVINREACNYFIVSLLSLDDNRNAEKEWIAERDAESPGQDWEKIARMCDFNPKASRNSKDTSRMRSILLQLKQQQAQEKSS
ncbi:clathrin light chain isoform X1 [Tetranychus urticae]|uniref:clathrin light chain isoform X1 n=1 Tax=Tetranychus urticae TaxID=32264 RepID=UPI000D641B14|nr:clathrin light chain isoform X1 [Tetranychus urticae]